MIDQNNEILEFIKINQSKYLIYLMITIIDN